ncbi:MAG: histidine phosphatase family protein [Candidatus Dadabacteria bacterium]|nr:histidine phosphatase family protein [Candidatus Dadabacteria bacterium]MYA47838.1 histidine phosphatase family protein [Candidatus Dadabacteria bacterium]MYG83059.1 histidine phosphatase family protein [Candidatus Dadabacteria bacterium]MYK49896.1 histidine phosphatase family protein [Candidatus Dadabacteria bacterium]
MRLTLVRHGKTDWNETGRCQGISDVPLNSSGIEQAEKLAFSLRDERIDHIYSSDLVRAKVTAEKIAGYHSINVNLRDDLREMDQGVLEGLYFSHIQEKYSHVLEHWRNDPETLQLPGGESLIGVQQRALDAIADIRSCFGSQNIVVVSHNMVIGTLLCSFTGSSLKKLRDYIVDEASKSVIEIYDDRFVIISLNDIDHLRSSDE